MTEILKDYLFSKTMEYLNLCRKKVDEILLAQLQVLGITAKDHSLTRKTDERTDEVWWHDHLILRARWTPELRLWYISPKDLAKIKAADPRMLLVLDSSISARTAEQVRNYGIDLSREATAGMPQELPGGDKPKTYGYTVKDNRPIPAANDACPVCKNGTIEDAGAEMRCRGECGSVFKKEKKEHQTYVRFECGCEERVGPTLGPFEFVQMTYGELRGPYGETLARLDAESRWHTAGSSQWWSDVIIYTAAEEKK